MQKILVIDDEESFRRVTLTALKCKGFEAFEADDGSTGLELARSLLPDLIICDVNMSGVNGYSTLERLRKDPATATIPFILMTGQHNPDGMRQGMELGADDYLPKPFTASQLFAAVNARLQKHQALRESAEKKLAELRANISLALPHELVTPLNGIVGGAEIIRSDAATLTPAETAELARAILQSADRLHRLIENFLLYAQLELLATDPAGREALRRTYASGLRELIEAQARQRADRAGRSPDLVSQLSDGAAAMSSELLSKVAGELLDNAFKFSRPGTPVDVTSSIENNFFALSIRDRGDGMEPAQVSAIGAYAQFDRKMREQQGSGLGLTIAKRVVELHGGHFEIRSQKGAGTTVTIRLPLVAS